MSENKLSARRWPGVLVDLFLLALVITGIVFRFSWVNWSQGANLHPDEYGLTGTLTVLKMPESLSDYFNTCLSPLSPYPKYNLSGQAIADGPDNRLRWGQWPLILLRWAAEATGNTGYDELRLMGRSLSALADTLAVGLIFLIGWRLYSRRVGLAAAALSALAVMQIQQSHFMTVDNFAVFFTAATMYCAVRIAQGNDRSKGIPQLTGATTASPVVNYPGWRNLPWYILFGVGFGMAVASRINLIPLGGMVLVAAIIAFVGDSRGDNRGDNRFTDLFRANRRRLARVLVVTGLCLAVTVLVALLTFRVTHPMAFRNPVGDTTIFTLHLNPDWTASMALASQESNGIGGGPPAEQWANRPAIIFPLMNLVVWGMGIPLGLMAWAGFFWAAWRSFPQGERFSRQGEGWQAHLLPLVWVGGYFLFMGTRWVKSIRYFLPIYPFLALLAAWALVTWWQSSRLGRRVLPAVVSGIVFCGTLVWAYGFVHAIYLTPNTRIAASDWFYQNVPGPFTLVLDTPGGERHLPVTAPDGLPISAQQSYAQPFKVQQSGMLKGILIPRAVLTSNSPAGVQLQVRIAADPQGQTLLAETRIAITASADGAPQEVQGPFTETLLTEGVVYYLIPALTGPGSVQVGRLVVANENWDEGLPVPRQGYDPFGQLYRGLTMEVRWYDDANKRKMFLDNLAQADILILPSQRAIWSAARIPLTYPMTLEYYRALFDGRLGFEHVATYTSPFQFGPLQISDVGGTVAWNQVPPLPLFNFNLFAAEEAFSVYDHPPVWILKKRPDFSIEKVQSILGAIDLNKVKIQSPRDATLP